MTEHALHHHDDSGDTTGVHGMLLFGKSPPYLSHLPMFMRPHNYQVIVAASLEEGVDHKLAQLRARFGADVLLTVRPEAFAITELTADGDQAARTAFQADVVLGHFEHGGDVITAGTTVRVEDVTHFRELDLDRAEPDQGATELEYLLFGDADHELFLAHRVGRRPSFDQLVRARVEGVHFTAAEIERQGRPTVTVPGRPDHPGNRLRPDEVVDAHSSAGQHHHHDLRVRVLTEIYFNEDELH